MNLLGVECVEAKKVSKLTSSVDFSLETIFALGQHGRCVDFGTVRTGNQIGGFEKHSRAMLPRQGRPSWACRQCGVDGRLNMASVSVAEVAENFFMLVRRRHGVLVAGAHPVSADVHGDLNGLLIVHLRVCLLQGFALWGSRGVAQHGFVDWVGDVESSVGHGV